MQSDLFELYRPHGVEAERTYANALLLALQACAPPGTPEPRLSGKQLFLLVTCGLEPARRHPHHWQAALDALLEAEHLVPHPEDPANDFCITEAALQRSRELFGSLPPLFAPVPRVDLNVKAFSLTEGLSWEYQRGILWKVYHQGTTYAYPRRLRRELGELWQSLMPPLHDESWNAVDELESTLSSLEPVPPEAWALP